MFIAIHITCYNHTIINAIELFKQNTNYDNLLLCNNLYT